MTGRPRGGPARPGSARFTAFSFANLRTHLRFSFATPPPLLESHMTSCSDRAPGAWVDTPAKQAVPVPTRTRGRTSTGSDVHPSWVYQPPPPSRWCVREKTPSLCYVVAWSGTPAKIRCAPRQQLSARGRLQRRKMLLRKQAGKGNGGTIWRGKPVFLVAERGHPASA